MIRNSLFALSCLLAADTMAQFRHMPDTIRYDLKKEPSLVFGLDGKTSFIRDMKLNFYGAQVGYLYNKRTNLHVGFYTTYNKKKNIYDNPTSINKETDSNTIFNKFGMSYLNFGAEYYFYNTGKWRLSLPASAGLGIGWDKFYRADKYMHTNHSFVMPVELGFNASYKLTWWVWLGAGIGTRLSLASQRFNGSYFTYGLQFRTEEIYNWSMKRFSRKK
jgi:hypothetical protein